MGERASRTVGFAIADEDRELLDKLVEEYGNGNRSEFLRVAMKKMEHDRIARRFSETRKLALEELGGKVFSRAEVDALIKEVQKS